jgi:hypothetical protein
MSTLNVLENRPCIHIVWSVPADKVAEMDAFWKEHEAWMREKHTSACRALTAASYECVFVRPLLPPPLTV